MRRVSLLLALTLLTTVLASGTAAAGAARLGWLHSEPLWLLRSCSCSSTRPARTRWSRRSWCSSRRRTSPA